MQIAIVGAGAAGCFCAINLKRRLPSAQITVYEAGRKALAKVAVTGGGRCNLTNSFEAIDRLEDAYPRGARLVRRAFAHLSPEQTMRWWEGEGVRLVTQSDNCVFPQSQDAMQIVRTLKHLMQSEGVALALNRRIERIEALEQGFRLHLADGTAVADRVVVTSGGGALKMLDGLGLAIEKPVPSLFTLKLKPSAQGDDTAERGAPDIRTLAGTVVENARLTLAGTAFRATGTLLLTDWGVSGPATLKLSAYAARHLADNGYRGTLLINYTGLGEEEIRRTIGTALKLSPQRQLSSISAFGLTARLWKHLIARAGIRSDIRCAELGPKGLNRLVATLSADAYPIDGRCHFKEEFVTCGGVSAGAVNADTLESRCYKGLYFAGEVLDIDGITGGFNLQAAWSTAMSVAQSLA